MAQTGFTPIQLYNSPTVGVLPTAGNLVLGELALNTSDENLYFKNTGGLIKTVGANLVANLAGKNVLINGDMSISLINGTTAVTPATTGYVINLWASSLSQASKLTFQQVTNELNSLGAPFAELITAASAYTAASTEAFNFYQPIEGLNFSRFMYGMAYAKAASLQFKANASVAGTYSGAIVNAANTRSYVFTFVLAANIDTLVTIQNIPGDTSGTWVGASSAASMLLKFDLGSGSTFRSSTINAWQAGNIVGATGSISLVATAGATLAISEVQFELGPVCTAYERKLISQSLADCQNQQAVSVLDFGADPTGVADSTTAFNNASASIPLPTVPAGNYKITGVLNSPSAFIYLGATVNGINSVGITAPSLNTFPVQANSFGVIGGEGSTLQTQYHSNWNVVQSNAADNPTEWQVYSSSSGGIVSTVIGTNQVNWVSGSKFRTYWAGLPYLYIDGTLYKVLAVTSTTALTVQTVGGGGVSWGATASVPYYFCVTSTVGTCNVNGTAVTWQTGQQFISLAPSIVINGTTYTATYNSPTSITLGSSAGVQSGVAFSQYYNINNELAVLRLQSTAYLDQENFCITQTANGAIIETQYGGLGKYRPIKIRTGENPTGTQQVMVALYPAATLGNAGTLLLGGDFNNEVLNIACNVNNVNYFFVNGATAGVSPSIAMRGADTNVGIGIDVQAAGNVTFTSHNFGAAEFVIYGVGGTSYLTVASSASATPILGSNGTATDIDVKIAPKGAGNIWLGAYTAGTPTATGYLTVKDASGTVRKLLCL